VWENGTIQVELDSEADARIVEKQDHCCKIEARIHNTHHRKDNEYYL
jgi:hypothetical protein